MPWAAKSTEVVDPNADLYTLLVSDVGLHSPLFPGGDGGANLWFASGSEMEGALRVI